jgi:capsular exopolysaccharide synthesis family protein
MKSNLVVADKSRNMIAEQFRVLRTNLNFLLQGNKTILVTSTLSGEGKSFISLNLAAVLAISGKKVALLEFDLRKPRLVKNTGLVKRNTGLSNYLARQTDTLDELYDELENYPTLHIYGCGPVPPNPAELMIGERMQKLFDELKQRYDFIVVDSAPVGPVSDAFNLTPHTDMCLYVVRQRATRKKQMLFINDLYLTGRLKNAGIVMNDVKVGARHGYYGHHYGYGYGYGYGYSNGYGYGGGYYGKGYGEYFDAEPSDSKWLSWFRKPK